MNGIHDLGGMHGFGPNEREADEPARRVKSRSVDFCMF